MPKNLGVVDNLPVLASAPASPYAGQMYVSSTDYLVRIYTGSAWVTTGSQHADALPWPVNTYRMPGIIYTNGWPGLDELKLAPLVVPVRMTIDQLAIEVITAAGGTGSLRAGIYASANGYPTTLIVEGNISTTATGVRSASVNVTLNPGLYFVGGAEQVWGSEVRVIAYPEYQIGVTALNAVNYDCFVQYTVSGSLPTTFTSTMNNSTNSPRVALRRSA